MAENKYCSTCFKTGEKFKITASDDGALSASGVSE